MRPFMSRIPIVDIEKYVDSGILVGPTVSHVLLFRKPRPIDFTGKQMCVRIQYLGHQ